MKVRAFWMMDYKELVDFYLKHKTFKVRDEETIMELFNYFVKILVAFFMQNNEQEDENTLLQIKEEKHNEMETDLPPIDGLDFDIPSEAEEFYKNYKGRKPKNVWAEFATFESNSIDMTKLDNVIFPKSKDFFALEKEMATRLNVMG
jgi:hypothetical protein